MFPPVVSTDVPIAVVVQLITPDPLDRNGSAKSVYAIGELDKVELASPKFCTYKGCAGTDTPLCSHAAEVHVELSNVSTGSIAANSPINGIVKGCVCTPSIVALCRTLILASIGTFDATVC